MPIVLLLVLFGLMNAVQSFAPGLALASSPAGVTVAAGFLLLTALCMGNLFAEVRLPRLTGYLVLGVLAGPYVTNLVSEQTLGQLGIFNGVATALIALTAGTEMDFRALRPLLRGILWITGIAVLGTVVVLAAATFVLSGWLPLPAGLGWLQVLAIAGVLGVTLAAQSPAVVVALRKELDADGPVSRTVLGVVVVSDLVIIVLFALTSSFARALLSQAGDIRLSGAALAWEIFGSGGVGILVGILVAAFLRWATSGSALFVVTVGFLVAEVGQRIDLDPLLVALAAGMFIRNATRHGERLHAAVEAASLPVYVAFFAVAGASIHMDALALVLAPATLIVALRAGSFLGGTRIAAHLAGSEPNVGRYAGFGLLPQAGLALALASLFARSFPELGSGPTALIFGVVAMNEIVAPVLYRWALARCGEGSIPAPTPMDAPLRTAPLPPAVS